MPREMFGDVTAPSVRVGGRKWYTVPLSMLAHTIALISIVIVPLLATGTLPMPHETIAFEITKIDVPDPPPVRGALPDQPVVANPDLAPINPPTSIEKEPELEAGFERGHELGAGEGVGVVVGPESIIEPPPPVIAPVEQKPVPVGGDIQPPKKIRDVLPVYPAIAQSARIQGVVMIQAIIGVDGRVQDATILRSLPMLDDPALTAVRQWIYTPTKLNGVTVPVVMTVTVQFRLN